MMTDKQRRSICARIARIMRAERRQIERRRLGAAGGRADENDARKQGVRNTHGLTTRLYLSLD